MNGGGGPGQPGAPGPPSLAIENARLFAQVRDSAETFQRLLLPTLSDLSPFTAATVYRPAAEPNQIGRAHV